MLFFGVLLLLYIWAEIRVLLHANPLNFQALQEKQKGRFTGQVQALQAPILSPLSDVSTVLGVVTLFKSSAGKGGASRVVLDQKRWQSSFFLSDGQESIQVTLEEQKRNWAIRVDTFDFSDRLITYQDSRWIGHAFQKPASEAYLFQRPALQGLPKISALTLEEKALRPGQTITVWGELDLTQSPPLFHAVRLTDKSPLRIWAKLGLALVCAYLILRLACSILWI